MDIEVLAWDCLGVYHVLRERNPDSYDSNPVQ